jgi:hypothetical protein
MTAVFFDAFLSGEQRRAALCQRDLFVYSTIASAQALVEFARDGILAELKPTFIHHPKSKAFLRQMLTDLGFDPTQTYWDTALKNSSSCYNYYQWNATSRQSAAQHVKRDTRIQPKAEEPMELDPQIRIVSQPGGAMVFSAAQMHSTVPNTSGKTRFSIDFRTVHYGDAIAHRGSPNVDSACTGTSLRDFLRVSDLERLPDAIAATYDVEPAEGLLIYEPPVAVG